MHTWNMREVERWGMLHVFHGGCQREHERWGGGDRSCSDIVLIKPLV